MSTNTPAVEVEDVWRDECAPGSFEWMVHGDDQHIAGMSFKCPKCKHLGCIMFRGASPDGGAKWDWNGSKEKPTAKPSILHSSKDCGWHGFLTDGVFIGD